MRYQDAKQEVMDRLLDRVRCSICGNVIDNDGLDFRLDYNEKNEIIRAVKLCLNCVRNFKEMEKLREAIQ